MDKVAFYNWLLLIGNSANYSINRPDRVSWIKCRLKRGIGRKSQ